MKLEFTLSPGPLNMSTGREAQTQDSSNLHVVSPTLNIYRDRLKDGP